MVEQTEGLYNITTKKVLEQNDGLYITTEEVVEQAESLHNISDKCTRKRIIQHPSRKVHKLWTNVQEAFYVYRVIHYYST